MKEKDKGMLHCHTCSAPAVWQEKRVFCQPVCQKVYYNQTRFVLRVVPKEKGDLYVSKGSPNGYTFASQSTRPMQWTVLPNTTYTLVLDPSVMNHPVYIGLNPRGKDTARVLPITTPVDQGTFVFDTSDLDPNTTYYLCCTRHEYMGFPIVIRSTSTRVGHRCIHNHYQEGAQDYFVDHIESRVSRAPSGTTLVYEEQRGGRIQVATARVDDKIRWETHTHVTQVIFVHSGYGWLDIEPERTSDLIVPERTRFVLSPGEMAVIPAYYRHQIVRDPQSAMPLRLHTIYAKDSMEQQWRH